MPGHISVREKAYRQEQECFTVLHGAMCVPVSGVPIKVPMNIRINKFLIFKVYALFVESKPHYMPDYRVLSLV
jgi:hypothetical protein